MAWTARWKEGVSFSYYFCTESKVRLMRHVQVDVRKIYGHLKKNVFSGLKFVRIFSQSKTFKGSNTQTRRTRMIFKGFHTIRNAIDTIYIAM